MSSPLLDKTKAFALRIIKVCNEVKREKKESILTNQLVRSGTSIGANIREAFYAHGRADFIAKLQIALKECSESEYWLELLIESGYYEDKTLLDQCIEIKKTADFFHKYREEKFEISASIVYTMFKTKRTSVWMSFLFCNEVCPGGQVKQPAAVKQLRSEVCFASA